MGSARGLMLRLASRYLLRVDMELPKHPAWDLWPDRPLGDRDTPRVPLGVDGAENALHLLHFASLAKRAVSPALLPPHGKHPFLAIPAQPYFASLAASYLLAILLPAMVEMFVRLIRVPQVVH